VLEEEEVEEEEVWMNYSLPELENRRGGIGVDGGVDEVFPHIPGPSFCHSA
jgi:hypothetical protein